MRGYKAMADWPKLPLPPLEVQKEIVAEIEGYQKVIDGARAVLDNYRPHIPIHPDWPMVELGRCHARSSDGDRGAIPEARGLRRPSVMPSPEHEERSSDGFNFSDVEVRLDERQSRSKRNAPSLATVRHRATRGTMAKRCDLRRWTSSSTLRDQSGLADSQARQYEVSGSYLLPCSSKRENFHAKRDTNRCRGRDMPKLNQGIVKRRTIPLPPLATQQAIVAEIEAEQALVAANRELIARFEKKIQATLARVWGEDEPAPAEA